MSESDTISFEYDALTPEIRQFAQQKADETHGLLKRTAEHVLQIGQNLKAVKEKLPHGQFLPWIEKEFEMSRWTARNFIRVADKLEDKWRNFHHLPVSVLYELASPSVSQEVLTQVQVGQVPPTVEAIREAREAERRARDAEQKALAEVTDVQHQFTNLSQEVQTKQGMIERLTHEITLLQERITELSSSAVEIREVEKLVVPPEVTEQMERLQQQAAVLSQQRDVLSRQGEQLKEEIRATARKSDEGEQERRIRLNWYKVTNEFRISIVKLLSQWPSPLDTQVFEADDWTRLSQIKELAQRFLEECAQLKQNGARVVESTAAHSKQRKSEETL